MCLQKAMKLKENIDSTYLLKWSNQEWREYPRNKTYTTSEVFFSKSSLIFETVSLLAECFKVCSWFVIVWKVVLGVSDKVGFKRCCPYWACATFSKLHTRGNLVNKAHMILQEILRLTKKYINMKNMLMQGNLWRCPWLMLTDSNFSQITLIRKKLLCKTCWLKNWLT